MAATLRHRVPESRNLGPRSRKRNTACQAWPSQRVVDRVRKKMATEISMLDPLNVQGATGFRAHISDVALAWGVDWRNQFESHTP